MKQKTGNWLGLEKEWNDYLDSQNRKAPYLDKDFLWWVNQFEIKNAWYENELKIADERWKRAEEKLKDYDEQNEAIKPIQNISADQIVDAIKNQGDINL